MVELPAVDVFLYNETIDPVALVNATSNIPSPSMSTTVKKLGPL